MKNQITKFSLIALVVLFMTSCVSVRVASDYDTEANFNQYKTFAFYKTGIDQAEINDIDKRRILKAIERELVAKGFQKSSNPDMLVSIFTKSRERVNVWNNGFGGFGWGGWGWGGWGWGAGWNNVSRSNESTLYIDLIDASKKELVWQGKGSGHLTQSTEKKEARIQEFVTEIMQEYPPGVGK